MKRTLLVLPILAALYLSACSNGAPDALAKGDDAPLKVEHIDGTDLSRVTLSAKAAERLGIATGQVREVRATGTGAVRPVGMNGGPLRKAVPYAAVLYDAQGGTWVYTRPEPLVFVRHRIAVVYIEGDQAVLSEGPPAGMQVVTVGAAELFGAEFEIGH